VKRFARFRGRSLLIQVIPNAKNWSGGVGFFLEKIKEQRKGKLQVSQ